MIVGQGNVAIDVARILAKPVGLLAKTDIAPYALDALARSRVRTISIVGRRGPVQAKFTTKELRELGEIEGWDAVVDPAALALNEASAAELKDARAVNTIKNFETFKQFAAKLRTNGGKEIRLEFCLSPLRIEGRDRAEAFVFERTELTGEATRQGMRATGELCRIPAGAVFRSIGYSGVPFPGLPFDAARNVVRNTDGRVCDEQGSAVPGVYVTGWIKRGPTGIIGTNRVDSIATVKQLIADAPQPKDGASAQLQNLLSQRGIVWTTFSDWLAMDAFERDQGTAEGRVRKKLIGIDEMLSHASASSRVTHSGACTPAEAATR